MSGTNIPAVGSITWTDLTVPNAAEVKDFYVNVVGWQTMPVEPVEENGWCMLPVAGGNPAAGICYARGAIADMPPQWLIYITVADVDAAARRCVDAGGKIVAAPRDMGGGRMCVIQDPAGAVAALFTPPTSPTSASCA